LLIAQRSRRTRPQSRRRSSSARRPLASPAAIRSPAKASASTLIGLLGALAPPIGADPPLVGPLLGDIEPLAETGCVGRSLRSALDCDPLRDAELDQFGR